MHHRRHHGQKELCPIRRAAQRGQSAPQSEGETTTVRRQQLGRRKFHSFVACFAAQKLQVCPPISWHRFLRLQGCQERQWQAVEERHERWSYLMRCGRMHPDPAPQFHDYPVEESPVSLPLHSQSLLTRSPLLPDQAQARPPADS